MRSSKKANEDREASDENVPLDAETGEGDRLGSQFTANFTLAQCQQQLARADLSAQERSHLLTRMAILCLSRGEPQQAIARCDEALTHQPDAPLAHYYRGLAWIELGQPTQALCCFDQAIACSATPMVQVWSDRGHVQRSLGQYAHAIHSYTQALQIEPHNPTLLSAKAALLAITGQRKPAHELCDRAIALQPELADGWNSRGVIFLVENRLQAALDSFRQAVEISPTFARAWCNQGTTLLRLGRWNEAIASFDQSLALASYPEAWHGLAWTNRGFAYLRLGQYPEAIASFDQALQRKPKDYTASLYRVGSLLVSGTILRHVVHPAQRRALGQNLVTILNFLKVRLAVLVALLVVFAYGQGSWIEQLRAWLPGLLSVGIVALLAIDLWKHRSRFRVIWQTYFHHAWLTYVRAFGIVVLTLGTYTTLERRVPPMLRLGWADLVFGQPGNIIFQPINTIATSVPTKAMPTPSMPLPATPSAAVSTAVSHASINWVAIVIGLFWLLLLLGIPFWAGLEERIFRRGANTWSQITVRSVVFGLIHVIAGIPLIGGIVLILPGFLFACRYKWVCDRTLKATGNLAQAQDAGVAASTADHAIYNAMLISLAVGSLLFLT